MKRSRAGSIRDVSVGSDSASNGQQPDASTPSSISRGGSSQTRPPGACTRRSSRAISRASPLSPPEEREPAHGLDRNLRSENGSAAQGVERGTRSDESQ